MKDKVMPSLVLMLICITAAILLTFAHELTKANIDEQKVLRFSSSVETLFGKTDIRMIDDNFGNDSIKAIAVTPDKKTAIQVCTDGYSKEGINILVGIDENGAISGIEFVSLGETPGLGSKVRDNPDFRQQFYGDSTYPVDLDAVSGATFSSRGMQNAVNQALEVYINNKEAIING